MDLAVSRHGHQIIDLGHDGHGTDKSRLDPDGLANGYKGALRAATIGKFSRDIGLGRAALAGPLRVTRLGHELINHAVELQAIIEPLAGQLLEPHHVVGTQFWRQLNNDPALGRIDYDDIFWIRNAPIASRRSLGHRRGSDSL